jgi:histidine triad (HIT) family protein
MADSNCIFCKIGSGQIPAHKVLETPEALAFLDIGPLAPGHVLLIPKKHYASALDAPAEEMARLAGLIPGLSKAIMRCTGAEGLNVLHNAGAAAGQAVFHLHIHLIPRRGGDKLGYRWNAGSYGAGEAESWRDRLTAELATPA